MSFGYLMLPLKMFPFLPFQCSVYFLLFQTLMSSFHLSKGALPDMEEQTAPTTYASGSRRDFSVDSDVVGSSGEGLHLDPAGLSSHGIQIVEVQLLGAMATGI